jgi:hypothetical protein
LDDWEVGDIDAGETRTEDIDRCLADLEHQLFAGEIASAIGALAEFDWRSSDVPGLTAEEELKKSGFRGTGGYGRVRQELLELLAKQDTQLGKIAGELLAIDAT